MGGARLPIERHIAMFSKSILVLLAGLLLSGCAQTVEAIKHGIQQDAEFNEIVLKDVRQAQLLAEATNDTIALKCWTYLEEFAVANTPGMETRAGKVVGVFSAYQKARNVRRTIVEIEISDQFRLECGPMLTDSAGVLGRLGIRLVI